MWLTSIFEGKDVSTEEDAREVFLCFENDAHALCFAWCLTDDRWNDRSLLHLGAETGNAFACSALCEQVWEGNEEEAFRLAQVGASQHERDGFYWLGFCFRQGFGCEKDLNLAKENFLIAAELGYVLAAADIGHLLGESAASRWLWFGRAALRGWAFSFLDSFSEQVEKFFSGSGNATVVFLIGRSLKGKIDMDKMKIFGDTYNFDSRVVPQIKLFHSILLKSNLLVSLSTHGHSLQHDCV